MKHPMPRLVVLGLVLSLAGTAGATELDHAAQHRLGLQVSRLGRAEAAPMLQVSARVIDPARMVADLGRLDAAQAAADASSAEYRRARALKAGGNASRKAVQAAQAQAVADQASVRQARLQWRIDAGTALTSLDPATQRRLIDRLVGGRSVLLRAEPLETVAPAFQAKEARLRWPGGPTVSAQVLGPLPDSPSGLGQGWLLQADSGGLVPGTVLTGEVRGAGKPKQGVLLPRSAVVRWNGVSWAYVMTDPTHFERRQVNSPVLLAHGWLVGAPFRVGERVVTRGAEALIAVDAAPVHEAAGAAPEDDD